MKIYVYFGALVVLLGGLGVGGYVLYKAGADSVRANLAAQIEQYRDTQRRLVERLEESNAKERIVTREKIKVVRQVVDNCADNPINPAILRELH